MAIPTSNPRWSTAGTNTDPGAAKRASGWLPDDRPPAQWFNYIHNAQGEHIHRLRQMLARNWTIVRTGTVDDDEFRGAATDDIGQSIVVGTPDPRSVYRAVRGVGLLYGSETNDSASGFSAVIWVDWLDLFIATHMGVANGETSPDGVTWTNRTMNSETFAALAHNGSNLVVAVGVAGDVVSSTNGTAWTDRTMAVTTEDQLGVAYGNGLWVSVGTNGDIHTSPDGITWTARTSGVAEDLYGVTYDTQNALWCVVGDNGTVLTSPNGTAWTDRTANLEFNTTIHLRAVAHDGLGIMLAGGIEDAATHRGGLALSIDGGVTWEVLYDPFGSGAATVSEIGGVLGLHWSASRGHWIAAGQTGDGTNQYSMIAHSIRG